MRNGANSQVTALIVAAGQGVRFSDDRPKQYYPVAGQPLLRHTVLAFLGHPRIGNVRCVIHPDRHVQYDSAVGDLGLAPPMFGGSTRQESVRLGLEALSLETPSPDYVLIHDGARPCVSSGLLERVVIALQEADAVIPGLPVTDTLKHAPDGWVERTIPRQAIWAVQTPQAFRFAPLLAAHRAAQGAELTDDAAVMEIAGHKPRVVLGEKENIKVTNPGDDAMVAQYLQAPIGGTQETRVGTGYDVHRFEPGDGLMLCGVRIPHDAALSGHSDADVALHALTDATLGALGAGDIGTHFPPHDPQWKGQDSAVFLRHAVDLVAKAGGRLIHADVTIIGERPKIGPHRSTMEARLAEIMDVSRRRTSVKATTTEKLGFTGRREGLAALASVTITLPMRAGE